MFFLFKFVISVGFMYFIFWICDRIKNRDDAILVAIILTEVMAFILDNIN